MSIRQKLKPYKYKNKPDASHKANEFLTTIKMNSSYLELVDRCFCLRGSLTSIGFVFLGLALFMIILSVIVFPVNYVPLELRLMEAVAYAIFFGGAYTFLSR